MDRQVDINAALGMRLTIDGANRGGVFIDHLNRCSEMVKQWPAWKVGVLDDRGQGVVNPPKRDELAEHNRDAELCRELRAFLLDQMEVIKGCVVTYKWLGNDTLTANLNDLLVAVRDGGAK